MIRPFPVACALVLHLGLPGIAQAQQPDLYFQLGAVWAAPLLHDNIAGEEITTQQSIAPFVRLGAGLPVAPMVGVGLEANAARGGFSADEGGAKTDLGNITTLSFLANLNGPIVQRLRWRAGIGMIGTIPSADEGIFLQGGSWNVLFSAGLDYYVPILTKFDLMIGARADTHTLTPSQTTLVGFSGTQWVPQVSLGAGLSLRKTPKP
jgi:hypothetical protein